MSTEIETLKVRMRSSRPPYDTWEVDAYMPFEAHGERFAVTHIPLALDDENQFRATHIDTGAAVPGSDAATMEQVKVAAIAVLDRVGSAGLQTSLSKVREITAPAKS